MVVYNNILAGASGTAPADTGPYEISKSLRFNSVDSSHLSRTPTTASNRRTWTWSGWVKRSKLGAEQALFGAWSDDSNRNICRFNSSDQLQFLYQSGSTFYGVTTTHVFRDPSAWYHLVLVLNTTDSTEADRAQIYVNGSRIADSGLSSFGSGKYPPQNTDYSINNTVAHHIGARKESGSLTNTYNNNYLADVYFIDGQALAATDFGRVDDNNVWQPKSYAGTYGTNGFRLDFNSTISNQALGYDASVNSPSLNNKGGFDTIIYTGNGSSQTLKNLAFQPDLVWIKRRDSSARSMLFNSIVGATKGIHSDHNAAEFTDTATLTEFTSDGFSVGSHALGNTNNGSYVAWAWKAGGGHDVSNSNGSITSSVSVDNDYGFSVVSYTGATGAQTVGHGLSSAPKFIIAKNRDSTSDWIVYHESLDSSNPEDKFLRLNQTNTTSTSADYWGSGGVTNSVFGVDNGILINSNSQKVIAYCWSEISGYSKFDSYSGGTNPKTVTTGFKPRFLLIKRTDTANHWMLIDSERGGTQKLGADTLVEENNLSTLGDASQNIVEFLDDGFKLTTTNAGTNVSGGTYIYAAFGDRDGNNWTPNNLIATAGLETARQGMDVVTYSGNGSTQSISSLAFQPDFVWIKQRDSSSNYHNLFDTVRGTGKALYSNASSSEATNANTLSAFNSDGFAVGTDGAVNGNSGSYVAWCWKAGGAASSNTDGTETTSASANTTYGFSVVTYTGTSSADTFGHGLGAVPKMIFFKARNAATNWNVYHDDGTNKRIFEGLNTTAAGGTTINSMSSMPSSTVLSLAGGGYSINSSGTNMVAYCWSEIPGFSRFGSYTGSGSAGNKVTTGFKPRFILAKRTTNISGAHMGWVMTDSARGGSKRVNANHNAQENDGPINSSNSPNDDIIFNDDGFTFNSGGSATNGNGETYIYAAFADRPPGEIIDSLIDTPTNITADSGNNPGNYATMNPLDKDGSCNLSNGNLDVSCSSSGWFGANATMEVIAGKTYFEATYSSGNYVNIGLNTPNNGVGDVNTDGVHLQNDNGTWRVKNGSSATNISSVSVNSIIGVAVDTSANTIQFFVNGTSVYSGTLNALHRVPMVYGYGTYSVSVNFGQRLFAYTPPANHLALVTTNLSDPTIADPSTAFDVALWSGTGSSQTISLGFNPDIIWSKTRSHAVDHKLVDSVRGFNKQIEPNQTIAEYTNSTGVTSTSSSGFTIGASNDWNNSASRTYVGWAWDAGSSTVTNTSGSSNSQVRANPSTGCSVVTYTGTGSNATIGHGLNSAPSLYMTKRLDDAASWQVYHSALGATYYAALSANDAFITTGGTSRWNDTAPTSSVFSVGTAGTTNGNGNTYVAYCFTPVSGYSSFGKFNPNGTTNNSFVYTGFLPKFLLLKYSSHAGDWILLDTSRRPNGPAGGTLVANVSNSEDGYYASSQANIDFLSNGFKIRVTGSPFGDSGRTVVYAAFADHPFKYSRAY